MAALLPNFRLLPVLTPAEVLVLLHGRYVNLKQLLQLTLTDLLLKKVLAVRASPLAASSNNPLLYMYVHRGINYDKYRLLKHEKIYTKHFLSPPDREIMPGNLIKLACTAAISTTAMRQNIMKTPHLLNAFERGFWAKLTDKVKLTEEGTKKRTLAENELKTLTDLLAHVYNKADKNAAANLLQMMHGNLFLTDVLRHHLLILSDEELDKVFAQQDKEQSPTVYNFLVTEANWSFEDAFDSDDSDGEDYGGDDFDESGDAVSDED